MTAIPSQTIGQEQLNLILASILHAIEPPASSANDNASHQQSQPGDAIQSDAVYLSPEILELISENNEDIVPPAGEDTLKPQDERPDKYILQLFFDIDVFNESPSLVQNVVIDDRDLVGIVIQALRDTGRPDDGPEMEVRRLHNPKMQTHILVHLKERSEALIERGEHLKEVARLLEQVGKDLEDGMTPRRLRRRSRMLLKLGRNRAEKYEEKAARLEERADRLEERGDPRSLRRARRLRRRAEKLLDFAARIMEETKTKARTFKIRAKRMAKVLKRLGIDPHDPDMPQDELKDLGTRLQRRAARLNRRGDFFLKIGQRLEDLWEELWSEFVGHRILHEVGILA